MTIITNLLLINLILVLIFLSGFVDEVDAFINGHIRFAHLPKPFSCVLCMTFWTSLLYIIISGHLSILSICLCLVNATLTDITMPLVTLIKNWMLKIIEIMNRPII